MTAAAGAEQRADLKFFAVIDHAVAKQPGYARVVLSDKDLEYLQYLAHICTAVVIETISTPS
jgi:hypothetical protein